MMRFRAVFICVCVFVFYSTNMQYCCFISLRILSAACFPSFSFRHATAVVFHLSSICLPYGYFWLCVCVCVCQKKNICSFIMICWVQYLSSAESKIFFSFFFCVVFDRAEHFNFQRVGCEEWRTKREQIHMILPLEVQIKTDSQLNTVNKNRKIYTFILSTYGDGQKQTHETKRPRKNTNKNAWQWMRRYRGAGKKNTQMKQQQNNRNYK